MARHVQLNSGYKIPVFGLGTWKSKPDQVEQAVKDAIDAGYRHIDCAMIYCNENEVGKALKTKIEDGTVKREELFITSKLWNTYHRKDLVIPTLKKSLADLKLEYVDLYLIHWPMGFKEGLDPRCPMDAEGNAIYSDADYVDTWTMMEEAVKLGLVKSIGISNFNKDQTERILASGSIAPAVLQVECHPYLVQQKLLDYCKSKGITLTAYSPLGSPTRPWAKSDDPVVLEDPKVLTLAAKYGKTPAQLVCRFQVQRGVVCIPKSVTKSRIIENIQIFDFELSEEDMESLSNLGCQIRFCPPLWGRDHVYFPFATEF